MIELNGKEVKTMNFPDGTLLMRQTTQRSGPVTIGSTIGWSYESESELFKVICLTKHLRSHGINDIKLYLPYIPNARQDRVKNPDDVFTLKYFAETINDLKFSEVCVLDPHSNVSTALINNVVVVSPAGLITKAYNDVSELYGEEPTMFYPDEGAMKRYSGMFDKPYCFGIKDRDWKTGKIKGLSVHGDDVLVRGKNILIVDDICSRGGTFYHAAERLKEIGANKIFLCVSHCENTVLIGDMLSSGLVEKVITTNSIYSGNHDSFIVYDWRDLYAAY